MKKTEKFNMLYEDTLYRFQQGGLLQGDVVKIRTDALNNDKIKPMSEAVKEQIKNAMETDLNLRVASIKSIRPNTTQNYAGYGTDAPSDYFVDIVVEYAPGLWREPMTLPIEILERVDTGINMAPIPDSLKRPNNISGPNEVVANDAERANPKANTKLSNAPEPQDGRSQAKKPEVRKGPGDGSPKKLNEKLEDVYSNMLTEKKTFPYDERGKKMKDPDDYDKDSKGHDYDKTEPHVLSAYKSNKKKKKKDESLKEEITGENIGEGDEVSYSDDDGNQYTASVVKSEPTGYVIQIIDGPQGARLQTGQKLQVAMGEIERLRSVYDVEAELDGLPTERDVETAEFNYDSMMNR